jgi:hypothetical protein
MRKIKLIAVAATMVGFGFGVWAAAPTSARVSPSMSRGIEPIQIMMNARGLPTEEFARLHLRVLALTVS